MAEQNKRKTSKRSRAGQRTLKRRNGGTVQLMLKGTNAAQVKRELIAYDTGVLNRSLEQARRSADEWIEIVNEVAAEVCGQ